MSRKSTRRVVRLGPVRPLDFPRSRSRLSEVAARRTSCCTEGKRGTALVSWGRRLPSLRFVSRPNQEKNNLIGGKNGNIKNIDHVIELRTWINNLSVLFRIVDHAGAPGERDGKVCVLKNKGGIVLKRSREKRDVPGENLPLISRLYNLLFAEDVYKRMKGFLLWGLVIFAVVWALSFFFLPEGALKNTLLVDKLFGIKGTTGFGEWGVEKLGETFNIFKWEFDSETVFNTWGNVFLVTVKNFLHHLAMVVLFIFLLNRFRIRRFPLGYFYFLIYTILIAIVVGTNSYAYPPQWGATLGALGTFLRFGIFEWFAYGLLAISTLKWTWLKADSLLTGRWEKTGRFWSRPLLVPDERDILIFGFLFLLAANFAEARLIVFYGYHLL